MKDPVDPKYTVLTMELLGKLFELEGIKVSQTLEMRADRQPCIVIRGDHEAAFNAGDLALEHGYPLCSMECVYEVRGRHVIRDSDDWNLSFDFSL